MVERVKAPAGLSAMGVLITSLLLGALCSCTPRADSAGGEGQAQAAPLDFALTNFTGAPLVRLYLSPHDSAGWGENVIPGDGLSDGATIDIRFDPREKSALWDLRAESAGGHYAEWKGLDLRTANRVMLRFKLAGEKAAVAEVE